MLVRFLVALPLGALVGGALLRRGARPVVRLEYPGYLEDVAELAADAVLDASHPADLAAVGIKANLKTGDWAKYLDDRNKAPGFDMYMIGWTGQYGAAGNFYDSFYGPGGVKDSGVGREGGIWGIEEFLELKSVSGWPAMVG